MTRDRFRELLEQDDYSPADIAELQESGDVVECAACGKLSAHAWQVCNAYGETGGEHSYSPDPARIAHAGAASCWEWECGHCRANNVVADAPILHPCYTHAND